MASDELKALDEIDVATMTVDKVCIERDRESGEIAWRFACQQMSPGDLMLWAMFYKMMVESGYRKRIEGLEKQVAELEGRVEALTRGREEGAILWSKE